MSEKTLYQRLLKTLPGDNENGRKRMRHIACEIANGRFPRGLSLREAMAVCWL